MKNTSNQSNAFFVGLALSSLFAVTACSGSDEFGGGGSAGNSASSSSGAGETGGNGTELTGIVRKDCSRDANILETVTGTECHNLAPGTLSAGPSWLSLAPGTNAVLYSGPNCTGESVTVTSTETNFCTTAFDHGGGQTNDNVDSIRLLMANRCDPLPVLDCLSSHADLPYCEITGAVHYFKCANDGTSSFCTYGGNCAAEGCISRVSFRYDLGQPQSVQRMRYRSDWWNKRPHHWELWASNSTQDVPQNGAQLVANGIGKPAPWGCVTGEACTDDVPIECCPNGRNNPQDTVNVGTFYGKYDEATFGATEARYWYFVVVDTYEKNWFIQDEFELFSDICPE